MPLFAALLSLISLLTCESQITAHPAEVGTIATQGEWPCVESELVLHSTNLPPSPDPILIKVDATLFGEEDPVEIGGAGLIANSSFDSTPPPDIALSSRPLLNDCATMPLATISPVLRC